MADEPSDTPPDRLSLDPRSPYFDEALLERGVGIKFNGQEKTNVIEYSISEGWIRVAAGRSRDRYGQPMTIKLQGKVEPYFERSAEGSSQAARGGRSGRLRVGGIGWVRAALVAPLLERPAAERQRRQRRHAALGERRRAIAEHCALRAFILSRDLVADPRAQQLSDHRPTPVEILQGSARSGWRMFPTTAWDSAPTLGWEIPPTVTLRSDFP